jgi:hypothetical protein
MSKTKLECTRTHGRWNKGDVASFDPDMAEKMTDAKNAAWKKATKRRAPKKDDGGKDPATTQGQD